MRVGDIFLFKTSSLECRGTQAVKRFVKYWPKTFMVKCIKNLYGVSFELKVVAPSGRLDGLKFLMTAIETRTIKDNYYFTSVSTGKLVNGFNVLGYIRDFVPIDFKNSITFTINMKQ